MAGGIFLTRPRFRTRVAEHDRHSGVDLLHERTSSAGAPAVAGVSPPKTPTMPFIVTIWAWSNLRWGQSNAKSQLDAVLRSKLSGDDGVSALQTLQQTE